MHKSSFLRMQWFVNNFVSKIDKEKIKILDVGSYDINGTYKELFSGGRYEYTGCDIEEGPNVDVVLRSPYEWEIENDTYDVVISGQAFEHIEFFWVTMGEMVRVLKRDGFICIIAPSGFSEHRYPVDCYRYFTDGMISLARYCELELEHAHTNCAPTAEDIAWYSNNCADSMMIARKPYKGETRHPNFKTYRCIPGDHSQLRGSFVKG